MHAARWLVVALVVCEACGGTAAPRAATPEHRLSAPPLTPAKARPSAPPPKPDAAGALAAVAPDVAWSEDGKWIVWRSSADHALVARTTDFVPVHTIDNSFRVGFAGNWLFVNDGTWTHFAKPEDGAAVTGVMESFAASIVTRSSVVVLDTSKPRTISRANAAEAALPIAKSCPATDDLSGITTAASARDLVAVDVQCQTRGAKPCTGARGNCESGASSAVIVDAARATTTKLAAGFWAGTDVVAFSPDAEKLLVASQSGVSAELLDAKTGKPLRRLEVFPPKSAGQGIGCAAWAPDSAALYIVTQTGVVGFSARSGQRVARAEHPRFDGFNLSCTAKVVDGFLVTTVSSDALVRFRLPKLDAPEEYLHPSESNLPFFSDDGRFIVLSGAKGTSLFDVHTWTAKPLEDFAVELPSFDPTSSFLALDRSIWDLRASRRVATLRASR